ncbi:M23 family metallopeptidase [Isoptericola sp. BMS4]|uniref:M23 family metallopeptidase n=1 Tax=Isoptericola sp. BMS4 TaxID=2527875 RepID=UPI001421B0DD|nr:M23 family metallopeptidase [Isoptericola sp. BMS4]
MEAALALASAWFRTAVVGWFARRWPVLVAAAGVLLLGCAVMLGGAAMMLAGAEEEAESATACTALGYQVDQAAYAPPPVDRQPAIPSGGPVAGFGPGSEDQVANARAIIAAGKAAGVGERGLVVAIATAIQESGLRNVAYGDRDSLGLFQQRPSQGWGTDAQVRTPSFAARAFFGGPRSPHYDERTGTASPGGLLEVAGWQDLPVTVAAQKVQRSAFPDAYAKHEERARVVVEALAGSTPADTSPRDEAPAATVDDAAAVVADYRDAGYDVQAYCEESFELASAAGGGGLSTGPDLGAGAWTAPIEAAVTSHFGRRLHPVFGEWRLHAGTDFHAAVGTPVVAPHAGVVEEVTWTSGGGLVVQVSHGGGIATRHLHLSEVLVRPGQRVEAGERIALTGDTGVGTGAHYHFEVHVDGDPVDPETFMPAHGVELGASA